ncbi:efflux RND transporter periplasmic adaptor subunit [Bythopirellula goksoeyrii]|uniref:Macrolide transporter subunit MacA n=1 Tax=Bythopirellula goksoeyrii TaxID=1400387 RepID=A0A5B9QJS7_9BACT|nr:HlyD family efflux transporter periplasmic adaptor subunit [Bythopirellula goksoeyrii]QEG37296.1 macrolide transporter subunit MacA [Bythopirellula goksoeyrii]
MSRINLCPTKLLAVLGTISLVLMASLVVAAESTSSSAAEEAAAEDSTDSTAADEKQEEKPDKAAEAKEKEETATESKEAAAKEVKSEPAAEEKDTKDKGSDEKESTDKAEKKKEEEKNPKPHVVKSKPLKIEEELSGIFVASDMQEIAVRPDAWSRFVVLEAVAHGTEVKKGELLVRFDDESIDDRLADESIELRLNELSLMLAEEETPREEKMLDLAFREAERNYEQLVEDHKYYQNTDRPFAVRIAKYRFDSAKEDLESQKEELAQLKKMYEADELTEETEAIVLRRQEFEVNTAELMMELQTASRDYTMDVTLPRNDLTYITALEAARISLEKARTARELGISRGKYELEQKREARARSVRKNADLLSDRALMELRSPVDGTVYYGRCVDGKWGEINTLSSKLVPYGTIPPNTVIMTIVEQRPLYVISELSEKDFSEFKVGLDTVITPTADEDIEITGTVKSLSGIPSASRKFEMQFELDKSEFPEWLVAGMSCKAKVTTYEKKDALQIPKDLVQTDKEDEKTKYVMVLVEDEEDPQRREIKVGHTKGDMVEILEGLVEGDKISKEKLKEDEDKEDEDAEQ